MCFFKQKTAYELRISEWSSDLCSSDPEYHYLRRPCYMLTAGPPPDAAIFRPLAPSAADASGISLCIRRVKPRKTPQLLRLSRIPTATPHNPPPDLPCGGRRLRLTQGH